MPHQPLAEFSGIRLTHRMEEQEGNVFVLLTDFIAELLEQCAAFVIVLDIPYSKKSISVSMMTNTVSGCLSNFAFNSSKLFLGLSGCRTTMLSFSSGMFLRKSILASSTDSSVWKYNTFPWQVERLRNGSPLATHFAICWASVDLPTWSNPPRIDGRPRLVRRSPSMMYMGGSDAGKLRRSCSEYSFM